MAATQWDRKSKVWIRISLRDKLSTALLQVVPFSLTRQVSGDMLPFADSLSNACMHYCLYVRACMHAGMLARGGLELAS